MLTFICRGFLNWSANVNLGKRSWICVELSRTLLQRKLEFIGMTWNCNIFSRTTIEILGTWYRIFSRCTMQDNFRTHIKYLNEGIQWPVAVFSCQNPLEKNCLNSFPPVRIPENILARHPPLTSYSTSRVYFSIPAAPFEIEQVDGMRRGEHSSSSLCPSDVKNVKTRRQLAHISEGFINDTHQKWIRPPRYDRN